MNQTHYYVRFSLSKRQYGVNQLDVQIHDYQSAASEIEFRSFTDIFSYIKTCGYTMIPELEKYIWIKSRLILLNGKWLLVTQEN